MRRQDHRWHSPNLGRDMELLAFGHAGARAVFFPPRLGRFYAYENWGVVEALRPRLDSIDAESLSCRCKPPRERIHRHERHVLDEVLPLTGLANPNPFATPMGYSLGAYHAANIALRHPTASPNRTPRASLRPDAVGRTLPRPVRRLRRIPLLPHPPATSSPTSTTRGRWPTSAGFKSSSPSAKTTHSGTATAGSATPSGTRAFPTPLSRRARSRPPPRRLASDGTAVRLRCRGV